MLSVRPWRGEVVLQFCGAQLFCLWLGLMISLVLRKAGFAAFQPPDGSGVVLLGTLGFQGATWLLIPLFLWQHQAGWREAFGLRGPQLPRALFLAGLLTLAILPVALGLQILSVSALTQFGRSPEEQLAVTLLAGAKSGWMRIYLGLFAVVLAPVAEEFIFRGVLYPFVKRIGYPRLAWIGVSLLFALVHDDMATLVPLFVLALMLTWLYELTDNLLAPIAAHSLFNAANLVLLFLLDPATAGLPSRP